MGKKSKAKQAAPALPSQQPSADEEEGLVKIVETSKAGDGSSFPRAGDLCTVHYVGTLEADGSEFDSSRAKRQPFNFTLGKGQVIRGWDIALARMTLGQRAVIAIEAAAAYGEKGATDTANASGTGLIPPNANLKFDVELLDINGSVSLSRFIGTLDDWVNAKLAKYDEDEETRDAMVAKHGDRDTYASYMRGVASNKFEAERAKKGPRAPTIEALTQALVDVTTELKEASALKEAVDEAAAAPAPGAATTASDVQLT